MTDAQRTWLVQCMTTEHFTLQTARATSVNEINGRATLFLGTLSSSIVALALVAQVARVGPPFFVFSFVLLPMVFFLGWVTFERILQATLEWLDYSRGINRVRAFYAELIPDISRYYVMPASDDVGSTLRSVSISSRRQSYLTMAGMIAVLMSLVAGVFTSLVTGLVLATSARAMPDPVVLATAAAIGVLVFAVVAAACFRHQHRIFEAHTAKALALFPPSETTT